MDETDTRSVARQPPAAPDQPPILDEEYARLYGEPLSRALDLATWQADPDPAGLYSRLTDEVRQALAHERAAQDLVRRDLFPHLASRPGAPPGAGVYRAPAALLERIQRGLLFRGAVEAAAGVSVVYETVPLGVVQLGVCLVSYRGDQGTWVHRLFRRDLRAGGLQTLDDLLNLLETRARRGDLLGPTADRLSDLARKGILAYAERALLLGRSTARWRIGQGSPVPYELLTGAGTAGLLEASLTLLNQLLQDTRWAFVAHRTSDQVLLSLGAALQPLEFAIVDTLTAPLQRIVEQGHYSRRHRPLLEEFVARVGPAIIVGVYRAALPAPPTLFFAHRDRAEEAALIALADSTLQEHRGFPLLLDLATAVCRASLGAETWPDLVHLAYAEAGEPDRRRPPV